MKDEWQAPYLPYDEIRPVAERFLNNHNPSMTIPVPIENIVEVELRISILPLHDLEFMFGIDSYLEPNLKRICIDYGVFHQECRCRFSVAHEIGHFVIHKEFFEKASFKTTDEYLEFRKNIDPQQEHWFEMQAYNFAGLVLVPEPELKKSFDKSLDLARSARIEPYEMPKKFLNRALPWLGRRFLVTEGVVRRRIEYDGLWEI